MTAESQTFIWVVIFFFASAGAGAASLTIGETWPVGMRAGGIVVSFAVARIAAAFGPAINGALTGNGSDRTGPFIGCLVGRQHAARSLAEGVGG